MTKLPFYKMSGSGNDFILLDNRDGILSEKDVNSFVSKVCRRKLSVGADGLILIESSNKADFKWQFFNADGSEAEMCGNGGRCAARFAYLKGIASSPLSFETRVGIIHAEVVDERVKIEMPPAKDIQIDYRLDVNGTILEVSSINIGVPHVVIWTSELDDVPVAKLGRAIRYHKRYMPAGTNVDFVRVQDKGVLEIRTYERGVEEETLACGTGAVAAAMIAAAKGLSSPPITVFTKSGESLTVHFEGSRFPFKNLYLEGDARVIYEGELWDEALDYR